VKASVKATATGEMKPVRRIEFADGSAFEAG
jgi:hypothetical protein